MSEKEKDKIAAAAVRKYKLSQQHKDDINMAVRHSKVFFHAKPQINNAIGAHATKIKSLLKKLNGPDNDMLEKYGLEKLKQRIESGRGREEAEVDWCTTLRHWLLQLLVRFAQKVACEVCCSDEEVWQLLFWCSCISTEVVLCATGAIAFPQKWLEQGSNTSQSQRRAGPQNIGCLANVRAGGI